MEKIYKVTYALAALLAVIIFIFSSFVGGGIGVSYAATSAMVSNFDTTEVLDDLQTATIDGKQFSPVNYPYDSTGIFKHPEIFTVVEYCYSMRPGQRDNYALYVYFYNPQAIDFSTTSKANKITMGVRYSEDKDGNLKVDDYEKFDLQFCSKSAGDYEDLFYKFKVIDHVSEDGKTIAQRVNSVERRYDISEIELLTVGDINATAYGVGGTFKFTGYAKGYGSDETAESTLACERADLETITLDIAGVNDGIDKRTYWRSNSSSKGAHYQNQINSVFFAIDTIVLEKFGYTLQRIKAEWWEYKTAPAVVIDNETIYNDMLKYCGKKISDDYDASRNWKLYNTDSYEVVSATDGYWHYKWSWNADLQNRGLFVGTDTSDYADTLLPLLFSTNGRNSNDFILTADMLQSYCEQYDNSYENGHLQFNEHDFSAVLFTDSVDDGRTRGYNLREFDITNPDDLWQLNSYDSSHNWFEKLCDYGFWSPKTDDEYRDVLPIQQLKAEDFLGSDVANYLKVNVEDVSKLRDYFNDCVKDRNGDGKPDNAVFLFRYAQTDYWAEDISAHDTHDATLKGRHDNIGEVRQGTQFFDFDVLTMTFNKDGDLTTLGCVSSPVDFWSGYTPSVEGKAPNWWKIIKIVFGILAAIVLIVLLAPFLGAIINGILWVISAVFNFIVKLFKKKE